MTGGVVQSGSDLGALSALATALSDPATLKKNIDAFKAAEQVAKDAEIIAQAKIDKAATAQKALDARSADMDARETKLTEDVTNAAARTKQLDAYAADIAAREQAMKEAQSALDFAKAAWATDKATAERNAATQAAVAQAALDKRAGELQAREVAVAAAERANAEAKAANDAWANRMAAASAR